MKKQTIAIVGLGLIGGSMALALRHGDGAQHTLLGLDKDPDTLMAALKKDAIDEGGGAELLCRADLVVLALPPHAAVRFLHDHVEEMKPGALVTDVCGVKRKIVELAEPLCRAAGLHFLGGHPMAGKERSGFDNADAELFAGASYILTPTENTPSFAVDMLTELAAQLGCTRLTVTSPENHDRMIAFTSQLPHVLAGAYVKSPSCLFHEGFSAGSYRDVSRVATVDPKLWTQLFLANRSELCAEIDQLLAHLQEYREAIAAGDEATLEKLLRDGREQKETAG